MKRLFLSSLILIIVLNANGQSRELSISSSTYRIEVSKYYYDGGSEELYTWEDVSSLFNMGMGYYIPVFTPEANLGIGVNATFTGGLRYHSNSDNEIYGDFGLPVTAVFRMGAGSTRDAYNPVGIGLGAGCRVNAVLAPWGDPFYIESGITSRVLFNPYLFAELVLDYKKRGRSLFDNFKIQFAFQPSSIFSGIDSYTGKEVKSTMRYYTISLIKFNALD